MKFKFHVGDTVRVLDGSKIPYYTAGWVRGDMPDYIGHEYQIASRKIHPAKGYPCYELVGDWHTWDERGLELVTAKRTKEKITVYRDGNKVVAIDQRTGKKGIARCHPDDEFDFGVGAEIAFGRLMERKDDAVCVAPPAKFKVGDHVIGNDQADDRYGMTTRGWIGTVMAVFSSGLIKVKGDEGDFVVDPECFDLYTGFLVGDQVKVINTGRMYTTNVSWVVKHVHDEGLLARYAYDDDVGFNDGITELDDTFTIRVIADDKAYIQQNDCHGDASWTRKCYLIEFCGLQRV